jgi:DNA-binding transcriptional regulator of glucitol operon
MRRLGTPRWLAGHVAALALVLVFLALGWWQVRRAAAGNLLSYGYAVQWPVFAGFVVAIWFREARRATRRVAVDEAGRARPVDRLVGADRSGVAEAATASRARPEPMRITAHPPSRPRPAPPEEEPDEALDAYNRYLAWLSANPDRRSAEYPGHH